ncbi:MAG: hypothetical protein KBC41_00425 [Candidatus Pacebacteria bacterium]|nr:hypothetical protein [Candidatus Paceibacterota bacterium]MBP9866531.1 hypothetical protein [Candidatus Paceibacterota bacterium]
MSRVLRPIKVFQDSPKEELISTDIIENISTFNTVDEVNSEKSFIQEVSTVVPSEKDTPTIENSTLSQEEVVSDKSGSNDVIGICTLSEEVSLLEEQKNAEIKDGVISDALQKLLDRKIEKAEAEAKASLEEVDVLDNTNMAQNGIAQQTVVTSSNESASISLEDLPKQDSVQPVKIPIISSVAPGQEIHVPAQPLTQVISEVEPVSVQKEDSNTSLDVPVDFYPAVSDELKSAPVIALNHQAEVVPTEVLSQVVPVVTESTQMTPAEPLTSNVPQTQVAEGIKEVHWFDKLFGNPPISPPKGM